MKFRRAHPDGPMQSEKDAPPNLTVRGFGELNTIKDRLEQECPRVVYCADTRESVVLSGGEFYPLLTCRLDNKITFFIYAFEDIPNQDFNLTQALDAFAAKGFDAQETVALLGGGHSTGTIHCGFIQNGLDDLDPSIDPDFLDFLRSVCQLGNQGLPMDYEGPGNGFGEVYFRSLMQGKGLLFIDQQLMSGMPTASLVETYAANRTLFGKDFRMAMAKLSNLQGSEDGEVRRDCRRVN